MKVALASLLACFLSLPALAQESWEKCFDGADFQLETFSFASSSYRLVKNGCRFLLSEIGGKGGRVEIDLCNPLTQIHVFESLDATQRIRHYAGSAGCPAPLFGADFALPAEQKGAVEFQQQRKRMLDILDTMNKSLSGGKVTLANVDQWIQDAKPAAVVKNQNTERHLACSLLLLNDYLTNCMAFEAKPAEKVVPQDKVSTIPGIHNQTILVPVEEKKP